MSSDPNDDVDRLFACFKCGLSPPQSALKERRRSPLEKSKKASFAKGESSSAPEAASAEKVSKQAETEKLGGSTYAAIKLRNGKQISPIVFYGSPHGAPVKKPSKLLRLLHEIHIDIREQNKLILRDEVWATFPRQEEAISYAKAHAQANIFSYQDHLSGQRRFLVSRYDDFWRRYRNMDSKLRHHYEVIQEGSPCHLYFDLEFNKEVNIGRNVDEMVDILISIILKVLFDKFSIQGNQEWVVELDSSTQEKFSRHLIIHIPKTAFKDNSHCGAFVSEICSLIASSRGSDPQLEKLFVWKDSTPDSPYHLFLDSAVYSRNRCFRLAFSSKAGKKSFLVPTGRFKCKNMSEQQVFMESLICRMDVDCDKLLTCKMNLDCKKVLCFDSEVHVQNPNVPKELPSGAVVPSTYFSGRSPFPSLDVFVESIASSGNISGRIRSWYWFSAYGLMIYSMSRNRYCERIGREHKSNHVIYVVDFQRGGYYQKCHDPECKGYRSPFRLLPWDVIPDGSALSNSTKAENYMEVVNIDYDLQHDGRKMEHHACDDSKLSPDGWKDNSWWQEAMRYADCVERMRNAPEFSNLDEDMDEDCGWWMDAEAVVSRVEKQIG